MGRSTVGNSSHDDELLFLVYMGIEKCTEESGSLPEQQDRSDVYGN